MLQIVLHTYLQHIWYIAHCVGVGYPFCRETFSTLNIADEIISRRPFRTEHRVGTLMDEGQGPRKTSDWSVSPVFRPSSHPFETPFPAVCHRSASSDETSGAADRERGFYLLPISKHGTLFRTHEKRNTERNEKKKKKKTQRSHNSSRSSDRESAQAQTSFMNPNFFQFFLFIGPAEPLKTPLPNDARCCSARVRHEDAWRHHLSGPSLLPSPSLLSTTSLAGIAGGRCMS